MKSYFVLAIGTLALLNSCKKSDTPTPTPASQNPSISLVGGPGYASSDYTFAVGSPSVTVKAISLSNTTTNSGLSSVYTTITSNNTIVYSNTSSPSGAKSHSDSVVIVANTPGTSRVEFKVTDNAGHTATTGINITIVSAAPTVMSIGTGAAITLGGASDPNPSHMNLYTGTTYSKSSANANALYIDLAYNKTKVYSPSDPLETNSVIKAAGVITHMDVYTAKAYSSISASDINSYVPSGATNASVASGTIIMFETNAGKKGVFQISSFNGSATSTSSDNISIIGQIQK
jgi:membrane-bound inhibitor of C-type lysozyme